MTLALLVAAFTGQCVVAELVKRRVALPPELLRKLVHIPAAVVTTLLPLVISFHEIVALGLVFAALMAVSARARIFTAIHDVPRRTFGEVFFPLGVAGLAFVTPEPLPFAYGVLVLGIGDGLAALVGGRFGRRPIPLLATRKTVWGTGTFFATSLVLGICLLAGAGVAPLRAVGVAAAVALTLTPVELVLSYGFDNLVLPALAGLLLSGL